MHEKWTEQQKMNYLKVMGQRIKEKRMAVYNTAEELAKEIQMDYKFYSGVERGEKDPSMSSLGRIAEGLGITAAKLLE